MFIIAYRSNKYKYIKVVQSYRQGKTCKHRFIDSLGLYNETRYKLVKDIIREWKPLSRSKIVLEELRDKAGRLQKRGYFRNVKRW